MRIEYEASMLHQLLAVAEDADENNKKIECVYLLDSEWDRLAEELNPAMSCMVSMSSASRVRNGWAVNTEIRVWGLTIRLEPNVKT